MPRHRDGHGCGGGGGDCRWVRPAAAIFLRILCAGYQSFKTACPRQDLVSMKGDVGCGHVGEEGSRDSGPAESGESDVKPDPQAPGWIKTSREFAWG